MLSQSFSDRARGLPDLMQPLVRATQELGRCTCHDESDPAARSCPWKGCIGPTLATTVASAVEQLSALRSCRTLSAASSGSGTGGGALGVGRECDLDIACAAELAMSDLLTKFHWVNQPPYLVWQAPPDSRESAARFRAAAVQRTCLVWGMSWIWLCGPGVSDSSVVCACLFARQAMDPAVAAEFIRLYDSQVQAAVPRRRVSEYLCGSDPGNLRSDMEQHAAGRGMSPSLREELFAYAACRLDDTVSESPHRDVSWVAGRARASKIPWWSASVRLRQNLRMLEDLVVGPVMMRMWPRWRTLAVPASSPWSPGALRAKPFLDAVHRVGAYAHVDASSIAVAHRDVYLETLRAREASLPLPARVWRDLLREFVRAVVADGHVYSAQLPREGPPSAQAMVSQEASSSLPTEQHFRVLDGALAQKKHNLTLRWLQVKSMAMPMSIQKFATVAVGGSQTTVDPGASEQRTLVPEGLPEVIDFLAFIPWDTVRSGMKTWSVVSGSSAGGRGGAMNVGIPVALSERAWVFTDPGTPLRAH